MACAELIHLESRASCPRWRSTWSIKHERFNRFLYVFSPIKMHLMKLDVASIKLYRFLFYFIIICIIIIYQYIVAHCCLAAHCPLFRQRHPNEIQLIFVPMLFSIAVLYECVCVYVNHAHKIELNRSIK